MRAAGRASCRLYAGPSSSRCSLPAGLPWRCPASRPLPALPQTQPPDAAPAVKAVSTVLRHLPQPEASHRRPRARRRGRHASPARMPDVWERVIAKLRAGSMPPAGMPRPDAATYRAVASWLEAEIDRAWAASPNPGRINAVHRLNRTEYNNAIRDLFALDLDVKSLLPGDETADGSFDNFADVLSISTAHLERYLSVARQVTRLAIGLPPASPALETFEIPLHVVQDDRQSEDLPFGSRGGIAIRYDFPVDGEYLIKVRLRRQYQDYIMGMGWPQQLDVRLDGKLLKRFTVGGGAQGQACRGQLRRRRRARLCRRSRVGKLHADGRRRGLEVRVPVKAGPRVVGVSFVRELWEPEGLPQPLQRGRVLTNDQIYMDYASVGSVADRRAVPSDGPAKDTPSRRAIFVCEPAQRDRTRRACATKILSRMARLAYRRPVTTRTCRRCSSSSTAAGATAAASTPGFSSRSSACSSIRTSCCASASASSGGAGSARPTATIALSDLEARLAPVVLPVEQHSRRAPARPGRARPADDAARCSSSRCGACWPIRARSDALVDDFAAQWLNLRRVGEVVVDPDRYPDFDESLLRRSSRRPSCSSPARCARIAACRSAERGLHVRQRTAGAALRDSRDLRQPLPARHAAESRSARRPARARRAAGDDVVSGSDVAGAARQMAARQHLRPAGAAASAGRGHEPAGDQAGRRAARPFASGWRSTGTNPSCASCHSVIDPLGFALENFDAIGGWRTVDESGKPVDATGTTAERREGRGARGPAGAAARASRSSFRARSPKSSWPTRSAAGSSTTIGRRCGRSSATRRRTTTAGRRSFWAL